MGGSVSTTVEADVDSLVDPGTKVIRSQALDEFCDYESFVNELVSAMKTLPPRTESVVKSEEYKETTPGNADDFTYKVVLDGQKLKKWHVGTGDDVLVCNRHFKMDRANRVCESTEWMDKENPEKKTAVYVTKFLKDPFRIEAYSINYAKVEDGKWTDWNDEGVHTADEGLANAYKTGYLDTICTYISSSKVKVLGDQKGTDGELCVKSEPDPKLPAFDKLLAAVMPVVKELNKQDPDVTNTEEGESELTVKGVRKLAGGDENDATSFENKTTFDKESGIGVTVEKVDDAVSRTVYFRINSDCTMEMYAILDDGNRLSSGFFTKSSHAFFNGVITQAEHDGSLLGMIGGMFG